MNYGQQFRRQDLAEQLADRLIDEVDPGRSYRFMEVCGAHTRAIQQFGIQSLMPENVQLLRGPGCPVCVLPPGRIAQALALGRKHDAIICAYGDMVRVVEGKRRGLFRSKPKGADVRPVRSVQEAMQIARDNPRRQVVFFATGFETTTAPTAVALRRAESEGLKNFSVFCNHLLTPAAIHYMMESADIGGMDPRTVDGFLGPAHASAVIGSQPYAFFAEEYQRPVVVAGFEPLDVMQAALMLVRQVNDGRYEVENQYRRAVTEGGNSKALALVGDVFELRRTFEWRGLGQVPYSAFRIKSAFAEYDAEARFGLETAAEPKSLAIGCARDDGNGACLAFLDADRCAYDRSLPLGGDAAVPWTIVAA